jgi:hypothetical protein
MILASCIIAESLTDEDRVSWRDSCKVGFSASSSLSFRKPRFPGMTLQPIPRYSNRCLPKSQEFIAKRPQSSLFQRVAIEHIVSVERDETFTVGVGDVDAGLLDGTEIEGLRVDELNDEDAEEIVVSEVLWREHLREAAEEFAEGVRLRLRGVVGREEFEDLIAQVRAAFDAGADGRVLLVDDRVATAVDQDVGRNKPSERNNLSREFQCVSHSEGIGMAGNGNQVFGLEVGGLVEDPAADLGQRESVFGAGVVEEAASLLNGLEGYAANTGLLQGEIDDGAKLVVIDAAFHCNHKRCRNTELVEAFEGLLASVAQIGSAQLQEGLAAQGVELKIKLEAWHVGGKAMGKGFILRDADAVGVDHEVANRSAFSCVEHLEELRVDGGFAAGYLHDVGLSFVSDDAVEHALDLVKRLELGAMGSRLRVADGAGEIASIADFEQRETGVLLVVGAESAVVGAAEVDGGVVAVGHLGGLDEDFAAATVVVHVVGDQHALEPVGGAAFEHEDLVFFEDDLGVDAAVTRGADGDGGVVIEVRANTSWHGCPRMFAYL